MSEQRQDDQLTEFVEQTTPDAADDGDLNALDQHIQSNPHGKGLDSYSKAGLAIAIVLLILAALLKLAVTS